MVKNRWNKKIIYHYSGYSQNLPHKNEKSLFTEHEFAPDSGNLCPKAKKAHEHARLKVVNQAAKHRWASCASEFAAAPHHRRSVDNNRARGASGGRAWQLNNRLETGHDGGLVSVVGGTVCVRKIAVGVAKSAFAERIRVAGPGGPFAARPPAMRQWWLALMFNHGRAANQGADGGDCGTHRGPGRQEQAPGPQGRPHARLQHLHRAQR